MSFCINSLVIYGKNKKKRVLEFNETGVTIISGDSETGKSSIADIISYCLGGDYTVKGKVKDVLSWYGLKIKFSENSYAFIARQAPPLGQKTTKNCYFVSGKSVEIPDFEDLSGDDSIEAATSFITREIGITKTLSTISDPSTKSSPKPHLKHSLYYCFLKQSNLAHEKILFHRQDEAEVKKYISMTAPYFLGAIPEETLAMLQKLMRLRGELRSVETSLKESESILGEGATKGRKLVEEAKAFGLLNFDEASDTLKNISHALKKADLPQTRDIPNIPLDRIHHLREEREKLADELSSNREQLVTVKKFVVEEGKYSFEVSEQIHRLNSVNLFKKVKDSSVDCPTCGSHGINLSEVKSQMISSIDKLRSQISHVASGRGNLGELSEELKNKSSELRRKISAIDKSIDSIYEHNSSAKKIKNDQLEAAKILGRINLYIETVTFKDNIEDLKLKKNALEKEIESIEGELDEETRKELFRSYLAIIGKDMTKWAEELKMEYAGCPHQISFSRLTVEALTENGGVDMQGMGSAKNWLGCHLIAYLGLQKWFRKMNRPVPKFIFMDQPSQVWFPTEDDLIRKSKSKSNDLDKARELYDWIFEKSSTIKDLQLIIVDHVKFSDDGFKKYIKEEWRDGNALVPRSWLKAK